MSIEVSNLTHIYSPGQPEEQTALDGISFTVEDGSFVGIIGHTGSGKSTLVQHLNGILRPTRGKIYVDGEDITQKNVSLTDIRKKVGLVFQYPEYQLFEETVAKDVAFGPKNLGLPEQQIDMRVRNAIELVGLDYEEIKDVSPFELSGGQKRRVAIAGVIAMQPGVLILDEPTAGLDPKGRDEILDQISYLHEKRGITIILVSHSMEDVARYADRLIVVNDGKLPYDGTPREVFAHYEELEKIGLAAPQITYIMHDLAAKGFSVDVHATTVEEAKNSILAALAGKGARR